MLLLSARCLNIVTTVRTHQDQTKRRNVSIYPISNKRLATDCLFFFYFSLFWLQKHFIVPFVSEWNLSRCLLLKNLGMLNFMVVIRYLIYSMCAQTANLWILKTRCRHTILFYLTFDINKLFWRFSSNQDIYVSPIFTLLLQIGKRPMKGPKTIAKLVRIMEILWSVHFIIRSLLHRSTSDW